MRQGHRHPIKSIRQKTEGGHKTPVYAVTVLGAGYGSGEPYPEQHCHKVRDLLGPHGFPEEYMRAIESHGYLLVNGVEPLETMEKVLYATDELTGLIAATALMRPGASILDLEVKSVKKKFKQKGFAAGVDREVILRGVQMLGMELDALIARTIEGMRRVAREIGLAGED